MAFITEPKVIRKILDHLENRRKIESRALCLSSSRNLHFSLGPARMFSSEISQKQRAGRCCETSRSTAAHRWLVQRTPLASGSPSGLPDGRPVLSAVGGGNPGFVSLPGGRLRRVGKGLSGTLEGVSLGPPDRPAARMERASAAGPTGCGGLRARAPPGKSLCHRDLTRPRGDGTRGKCSRPRARPLAGSSAG